MSRRGTHICLAFYIALGGGTWSIGSPPSGIPRITDIYITAAGVLYSMRCSLITTFSVPPLAIK